MSDEELRRKHSFAGEYSSHSLQLTDSNDDDHDSNQTIDYDDQNLNYIEYWATQKRLLDIHGSATTCSDYLPHPPDCIREVKRDTVIDDDIPVSDDEGVEIELIR